MINYATTRDYDKISVLIFDGDNHIGSGCLLWSRDESTLYCITANHCTCSPSGEGYNIKVKALIDGKTKELSVTSQKFCNQDKDIAVYIIEINEYTQTIPCTQISNLLTKPEIVHINGYPQFNNCGRCCIPADFISNNDDLIYLNVSSLDAFKVERFDEVKGISGSGCYEVKNNIVKFIGIENKAINNDITFKELHAVTFDIINNVLKENHLALLPIPTPSYITEPIGSYKTIEQALTEYNFQNEWAELELFKTLKTNIFNHLSTENLSLYLCGLSGIGKTRSVLQMFKQEKQDHAIYYSSYEEFNTEKHRLRNYATSSGEKFIIIIDEVQLNNFTSLNNEFESFKKYFKFILIGTMSKSQQSRGYPNILFLNPVEKADVIAMVLRQYPNFTLQEQEEIYNLSHNDLRLAILISRLYFYEKENTSDFTMPILKGSASKLIDEFSSAESILKKTLQQHKETEPEEVNVKQYFNRLSLFVDIGYKKPVEDEINALADFFGTKDVSKFKVAIRHLLNINLGIEKLNYFEPSPRALSKLAFEQQGWELIRDKIDDFMDSIPNDLMRKRFFDRVDECSMTKEVNEALASWFCNKYSARLVESINHYNATEVMLFVEHNPPVGLNWVKDGILNETDEAIKNFTGLSGRRNVVWTCEHLANFKEWFFDCEEILYKLAQNENEIGISNNSQGVWNGLFSPILSNTEVTFYERFDLLIKRALICDREIETNMFKTAFSSALNLAGGVRNSPPQMVGGIITPPNWQPETSEEMLDILKYSLSKIESIYCDLNSIMKNCIFDVFSNNLSVYIAAGLLGELKEVMGKIFANQKQKNIFITKLEWQIRLLKNEKSSSNNILVFINCWINELKDNTLEGRVDNFLNRSTYSYGYNEDEKKKWNDELSNLAKDTFFFEKPIDILENIITKNEYNNECLSRFAEAIAKNDYNVSLVNFIAETENTKSWELFAKGYFMGAYNIQKKLPRPLLQLLNRLEDSSPNFVLWATIIMDITLSGYERIIKLLNMSDNISCVENMRYKEWFDFLDVQQKVKLLSVISECKNNLKYIYYFELILGWLVQGENSDSIYQSSLDCFEKCLREGGKYQIYTTTQIFNILPSRYHNRIIEIITSIFDFNESYSCINPYIMEVVHKIKDKKNENKIMECFGERLLNSRKFLKGPAMRGFFNEFTPKTVIDWIEVESDIRAPLIAYHLDAPTLENKEVSILTEQVLENYCTNDVYKAFILGGYNFKVYSAKDYYDKKSDWHLLFVKYETSTNELLKKWASFEKRRIEQICKEHEDDMAKMSRYE